MITSEVPKNWHKLQNLVAEILSECGFKVEVEKTIETARGTVEIDVYAEEEIMGRKNIILCECKLWKHKIPKTVIHSFRTVMEDFGANTGYIISSKGYQSGAYEAAQHTNTNLMTWEQFQETFEDLWYKNYFQNQITNELDALLTYTEPLLPSWFDKLSQEEKVAFYALKDKYDLFGMIVMSYTIYHSFATHESKRSLPVANYINNEKEALSKIPEHILKVGTYKEFLNYSMEYGKSAIDEFRVYKKIATDRNQ